MYTVVSVAAAATGEQRSRVRELEGHLTRETGADAPAGGQARVGVPHGARAGAVAPPATDAGMNARLG